MSSLGSWKCVQCGERLGRAILIALAIDAGAKTIDPCLCPKGGDHDFREPIEKEQDNGSCGQGFLRTE